MRILFDNPRNNKIKVSIILLDWSCRESFHTLQYLNDQSVDRDQYEIIWIEFYDARPPSITNMLQKSIQDGRLPIIDKWIIMEMPNNIYYHKHLMYNVGIVASSGNITVICDSDAMVKPSFIQNIIKSFDDDPNIVLHIDEVRNLNRKFYPFNYHSFDEILGEGCINWVGGRTAGLAEKNDFIHMRNYGACMCALRQDLINIGGADEHIDYLGHICGPYEMTFRLINTGRKEIWHDKEFLYHTWHPGSDGLNNYLGPHDGRNVSTRALQIKDTGRILPFQENEILKQIRLGKNVDKGSLINRIIDDKSLADWEVDDNKFFISFGRIAYHRKEFDEAIKNWKKVSGPYTLDDIFLNEFARAYYFRSEYNKAIELFNTAIVINPNNALVLAGLGWAHLQKKDFTKAKEYFETALKIKDRKNEDDLMCPLRGLGSLRKVSFIYSLPSGSILYKVIYPIFTNLAQYSFSFYSIMIKIGRRLKNKDFRVPESLKRRFKKNAFTRHFLKNSSEILGLSEYLRYDSYPCEIPGYNVKSNLDFLLLELPPRYMPLMPNGLGYVHNILSKCGISFQTIDANIAIYHKYHENRLKHHLKSITTSSGYAMVEDPWANFNMSEWDKKEVIDFFMFELKELIAQITMNKPKAVGISLSGNNRNLAKQFVKELRKNLPHVTVVVGGYDCVYHSVGQTLFSDFDYMVIGEAELTLEALVKALAKGDKPKDLPGIVSRYDSPGRVWEKIPLLKDLDLIDFPTYQWAKHVWYQDCERKHLVPITASRGCNWGKCRFCGECFTFRIRNPKKVADEIEYHTKNGFNTFHFNESDVNGAPQILYDLCSEIIKRRLRLKFMAQLRIDKRNTADYFKHLASAGFTHLRFGVDGWTDKLMRLQNKGYNLRMVFQNLRDCHNAGITTTVNTVIGVPGETEEDVDETIENIVSCKNYISIIESFNTLLLIAGSEYYRNPDKYKIRFRVSKETIYSEHAYFVPPELWYSEDPYIDQEVRMRRVERIISGLYENGVNIGSFASKVVEDLRRQRSQNERLEIEQIHS